MTSPKLYLAPLDGLRFFAFLAVFFHHMSDFTVSAVLDKMHNYGWVGVELFFLISSFLFFHLLDAEYVKTGGIGVRNFFVRRFLRIYPLMILFPIAMLVIHGSPDGNGYFRLAGLALFLDTPSRGSRATTCRSQTQRTCGRSHSSSRFTC
ncbi:acyltransferase family protein [Mesorhizobium sp. M0050]|uniref:acyltransferase family protein n=1 Tax=Mesorhizobium sp. M0050 TaxID=2956861 RepID=UPI00333B8415